MIACISPSLNATAYVTLVLATLKRSKALHDVPFHELALESEEQNRLHRPQGPVHGLHSRTRRAHCVEVIGDVSPANGTHFARPEGRQQMDTVRRNAQGAASSSVK